MQRIQAAEGFVFPSNPERRERYSVIIAGLIQQFTSLSNLWTVPTPPCVTANKQRLMPETDRLNLLAPLILATLSQVTEDILLLPSLSPPDSQSLSSLYAPLLQVAGLFPRGRISEFVPPFTRYRVFPQLLEVDAWGILALWRNGRLRSAGWDAGDIIEILDRRFGRSAEGIAREIRRH
jgi:hypothetical protein